MADVLSPKQRSYCMSKIRGKNTSIERVVRSELHRLGYRFRIHDRNLPGSPDIVMNPRKIAVFVDGDFWHGKRFAQWKGKLSPFWRDKIQTNILRDQRNFRRLKKQGWRVIRIWESQLKKDKEAAISRLICLIEG